MFYIPFLALVVISIIYRADFGLRSIAVYWSLWIIALVGAVLLKLQPGYFIAFESALAIAMLLQLRVNPEI